MANPQKDLQEEEINKKKQEALANIELELKFKKVLDKNPVFKLGFDADRFYVQKEPRSDKERLNIKSHLSLEHSLRYILFHPKVLLYLYQYLFL